MAAEMPPLCGDDAITVEFTGDPKPTDRVLHTTRFGRQFSQVIRNISVPNPIGQNRMPPEFTFRLSDVGKSYAVFSRPEDRLKQLFAGGRKRYLQEFWALQGVTFDIHKGESVGIIGRNGAGKSTLLQVMCGTLRPSAGRIEVAGRVAAMLELGAGFNPEFTGRENVHLAAAVLGLSGELIRERCPSIVEFAGIGDFIDQPVKYYSSGMYCRLAFAVAAHVDADILIVDEILSVGDAAFQQKCMRYIDNFRARGTLLLVSHSATTVAAICDRAVWLDAGSVRAIGPAKQVCTDYLADLDADTDSGRTFRIGASRKRDATRADPKMVLIEPHGPRNVIQATAFDRDAPWCGYQGAAVTHLDLLDAANNPVDEVVGGSNMTLRVSVHANQTIERALVGFQVRNEEGQHVFGENTHLAYRDAPFRVEAGQDFEAVFDLRLPFLPAGRFTVVVAVSDGTTTDNLHHQWIDDALYFRVPESHVQRGLVGVPITRIDVTSRPLTEQKRVSGQAALPTGEGPAAANAV